MIEYRDEMQKIIYEEFGDVLREKDRMIEEKKREQRALRQELKALKSQKERDEEVKILMEFDEWSRQDKDCKDKIRQLFETGKLTPKEIEIAKLLMLL